MAIPSEQRKQEDRDKSQPQAGEHVGEVGDAGTPYQWTGLTLPRHRLRITGAQLTRTRCRYCASVNPQDYRPLVRRARTSDVPAIKRLVDTYAGKILLEKNLVTLYEAVQEFWVAEHQGNVVGCGALHVLWSDLGEVRTVAVDPTMTGRGIGHAIVDRLIEVARDLQLRRLFVLTFETEFFSKHGFTEIEGTPVTAEVYEEMCRSYDLGVAEFLDLSYVKPNILGNSRMLLIL
jgi:amino-acid N-acetyltransferase